MHFTRLAVFACLMVAAPVCLADPASAPVSPPCAAASAPASAPTSACGAAAAAVSKGIEFVCPNFAEVMARAEYPREAARVGVEHGRVMVEFMLMADGRVTDVRAIESTHPTLAEAAIESTQRLQCRALGRSLRVRVPFGYQLEG